MSAELRSVTVKLRPEMFEQISFLAQKRGETLSDMIRHLVSRGLEDKIYRENTELLSRIVREQVEAVLNPRGGYPCLDDTENPVWDDGRMFSRRVVICRVDKRTNEKKYSHIA